MQDAKFWLHAILKQLKKSVPKNLAYFAAGLLHHGCSSNDISANEID